MSRTKTEIQEEALPAVIPHQLAGVQISMGVGKTLLGLKHMCHFFTSSSSFLVVAPRLTAIKSWKEELVKYELDFLIPHISFSTYIGLNKLDPSAYDIVYFDECHSLKSSHMKWLSEFTVRGGRVLGLTGTYPTNLSSEKGIMCNTFCPNRYIYTTDEAITDKLLNDYKIIVHFLPLSKKRDFLKVSKDGKRKWYTSEYEDYMFWTKRIEDLKQDPFASQDVLRRWSILRMNALKNYQSKERYAQYLLSKITNKVLVFATTKEQASKLSPHCHYSGLSASTKNLEDFKKGHILRLGAVEQLSEGINIPKLETILIIHSYGNERKASQKIGRALRLSVDATATVHILCYKDTVDENWVKSALETYDSSKIKSRIIENA
jgi:superfamily II DNA or RNA helicase